MYKNSFRHYLQNRVKSVATSIVSDGFLGAHLNFTEEEIVGTYGVHVGGPKISKKIQAVYLENLIGQIDLVYGKGTFVPVGDIKTCFRPCWGDNVSRSYFSSLGRITEDLAYLSPYKYCSGLAQSGWTMAGYEAWENIRYVCDRLVYLQAKSARGITISLIGNGPAQQLFLGLFNAKNNMLKGVDFDNVSVIHIYDDKSAPNAHSSSAALFHIHLGGEKYVNPILSYSLMKTVLLGRSPLSTDWSKSAFLYCLDYLKKSFFNKISVVEKNRRVVVSMETWDTYFETCKSLGLESGFDVSGYACVCDSSDKKSLDWIYNVAKERGEKGYRRLHPQEAKFLLCSHKSMRNITAVLFESSSLSPQVKARNGQLNRAQFRESIRKVREHHGLCFTEIQDLVSKVEIGSDKTLLFLKNGDKIESDITLAMPGISSISGSPFKAPFSLGGISMRFKKSGE